MTGASSDSPISARAPRHADDREQLDRLLRDDGAACIDLFDPPAVDQLLEVTSAVVPTSATEFFASPAHRFGPDAAAFQAQAMAIAQGPLHQWFGDHRPFLAAATVKPVGAGPLRFHQDWTYTDERRHQPVFLWVPLVDVDASNGVLQVVVGSHRGAERTIRPSRGLTAPQVTEPLQEEFARRAATVTLHAGQALVFHPAILHGSGPNRSDRWRPAITFALVPADADLVHFHEAPDGELTGYRVEPAFFTEHPYGTRPHRAPDVAAWAPAITTDDLVDAGAR